MLSMKSSRSVPTRIQFDSEHISEVVKVSQITQEKIRSGRVMFAPDPTLIRRVMSEVNADITPDLAFWLKNYYKYINDLGQVLLGNKSCAPKLPLRDFQAIGSSFLQVAKKAVLGDEMGLGKSITAIDAAISVGELILVCCPAYLKYNWKEEIKKWLPYAFIVVADGSKKRREQDLETYFTTAIKNRGDGIPKFLIINPEQIQLLTKEIDGRLVNHMRYASLHDFGWDVIIWDEAHRFQNRKSAMTKGMNMVMGDYEFFLQGHITNDPDPSALWPILHKIDPIQFSSYWNFVSRHCEMETGFNFKGIRITGINKERLSEWKEIMLPYYLERKKIEVASELPDKIYKTIYVPMEEEHRIAYKKAESEAIVGGEQIPTTNKLALIMKLRQILLYPAKYGYINWQPVTKVVLELVKDMDQVIMFGWFKEYLKDLSLTLTQLGISNVLITGETPTNARHSMVQQFRNGQVKVLIGNIAACGTGLNLDNCSNVIMLEPDWDPAMTAQAEDRVHRLTTTVPPTIINLVIKDTISEYVYKVRENKRIEISTLNLSEQVFNNLIERRQSSCNSTQSN